MKRSRIVQTCLISAVAAACAALITAQPASAAQLAISYGGTQVEVDDSPLNGAASWLWVYNYDGNPVAYVRYADGSEGRVQPWKRSMSFNLSGKAVAAKACYETWDGNYKLWFEHCGSWTSVN